VVWALVRTVGLPVGPAAGVRHGVGLLDGPAAITEVALIPPLARSRRPNPSTGGRLRAGSAIVAVALAFLGTGTAGSFLPEGAGHDVGHDSAGERRGGPEHHSHGSRS